MWQWAAVGIITNEKIFEKVLKLVNNIFLNHFLSTRINEYLHVCALNVMNLVAQFAECDDKECEQLCLNIGQGKGVCECAEGYYIDIDGTSCIGKPPRS